MRKNKYQSSVSLQGSLAQASGNSAQLAFEASYTAYRSRGLATGQRNYPEIVQWGCEARVIGKASTDYTALITGGKVVQFEVKTWGSKDTHTMSFDGKKGLQLRQQYLMMLDYADFVPTVYLVLWRWGKYPYESREWRIYSVKSVPLTENGLQFKRQEGSLVMETTEGWPDWLGIMTESKRDS